MVRAAVPHDDRGSAPVEFVLVGALLTLLTLAVLQFGLAVYVRNVVHDAAVEGAHLAALADTTPAEGVERTATIIERALGDGFAGEIDVREHTVAGQPVVAVSVHATLPLIGLLGVPATMEVVGRAPIESLG